MKIRRKIKSLTAFSLLFLLLFHLNGQFIVFKIFEFKIKKEIKTKIKMGVPENELTLLKIPFSVEENSNKDFKRIHEREFRYKNEMYDIVKKEIKKDTTYYYCIHDEEETKLFAGLDKLIKNEMNSLANSKSMSGLIKVINGLYFNFENEISFKQFSSEINFGNFIPSLKQIANSPLSPPPKFYSI